MISTLLWMLLLGALGLLIAGRIKKNHNLTVAGMVAGGLFVLLVLIVAFALNAMNL